MTKKWLSLILCLILLLVVVLVYWGTTKSFYQQDEWVSIGLISTYGLKFPWINVANPVQFLLGQGRTLASFLSYFLTGNFPFSVFYVSVFGISLHTINAVLVFLLARKITKNIYVSFTAALFFALNSVSQQAVTWPATLVNALPATTLVILSIFSFIRFLEGKNYWINVTFVLLYVSLFFKELGIYLFLFYPVFAFFYRKSSVFKWLKSFWLFILFVFFAVSARLLQFKEVSTSMDLFITGASKNYFLDIFLRMVYYPLTSFSLTYLPVEPMFNLAKIITRSYYFFLPGNLMDLVAQTAVLDGMAVFSSIFFGILFFKYLGQKETKNQNLNLLLGIFIFSFLPYAVITKSFAYLESRYYYLASVPAGILLGMLVGKIYKTGKLASIVCISVVILLVSSNIIFISKEIDRQILLGNERQNILNTVLEIKPKLGNRNIFYLSGDRNYYISQGNNVPMQQGMGYTFLTWYWVKGKSNVDFSALIKTQFLWGLGSQGYKDVDGKIFGYYWDISKLKEEIKKGSFRSQDVVGLYYNSSSQSLTDITPNLLHE